MNIDTGIQYQLPQEMFNENKRPPGHVCDPLIRQAARTATKVLEELNLPHQITHVDQRDDPQANMHITFYGVQINLEGSGQGCESIRYGWTNRRKGRWDGAQFCRTHFSRPFPLTYNTMAEVIAAWKQKGLISHFHKDKVRLSENDSEALAKEHGGVSAPV